MACSRAFTLCFSSYFSPLCFFCVFSGSKGLREKKDAFWSILEQNWAWNGWHMIGAKMLDEFEGLVFTLDIKQRA